MWADVDTKQDFLNYSEVADLVIDVIRDLNMRPVTVGVFGSGISLAAVCTGPAPQ